MPKIDPSILKHLRTIKGMSLEDLASRTKVGGLPSIDKQTIWRLEQKDTEHFSTRARTISQIARALGVEPQVLTGEKEIPTAEDDDANVSLMSKLSFSVSASCQNALHLLSDRYHITQQEIIELAPFLFCWAAEASLLQRKTALEKAEAAFETSHKLETAIRHISSPDTSAISEKFKAERESLEGHDLFGITTDKDEFEFDGTYDDSTENPFAKFLDQLAEEFNSTIEFDYYAFRNFPEYRVCIQEVERLADGDEKLIDAIQRGLIFLNKMPEAVNEAKETKTITAWIKGEVDRFYDDLKKRFDQSKSMEV